MNKEIYEKIKSKQKFITTNENLAQFEYIRKGFNKSNNQLWMLKEYSKEYYNSRKEKHAIIMKKWQSKNIEKMNAYQREYKRNHPEIDRKWKKNNPDKVKEMRRKTYLRYQEDRRERGRKYYKENKEELLKKGKEYKRTHRKETNETMKKWRKENPTKARSYTHKHKQKGFIPLNKPLDVDFDWHHSHKKLPFVIAVPRSIHRSFHGSKKNHCDLVNSNSGWNIFVDNKSDVTSLEFVESVIEIKYPNQFKTYWFGEYLISINK